MILIRDALLLIILFNILEKEVEFTEGINEMKKNTSIILSEQKNITDSDEKVLLAKEIATKAHEEQTDKAGKPYITHPQTVAGLVNETNEKIVAWLHDTVEDTDVTVEYIREQFGDEIAEAVNSMTHRADETYDEYVERLSRNPLARKVKLADLTHNMDLNRIEHPTENDYKRVEKYKRVYEKLKRL